MSSSRNGRWRLNWTKPSTDQVGVAADADGVVTLWIASDDPAAIKAFVAAQDWAADAIVEIGMEAATGVGRPLKSVLCRPIHVELWDPQQRPLPLADSEAHRPQGRSRGRLALLQAIRRGVDEAVAVDALFPEDGEGLILLAQDALDRRERLHENRSK